MATHGARPDLPLPDRGALRRARPAPDDRAQRDAVRHRVHDLDRGARGHHDRHLGAPTASRTIQVAIDPSDGPRRPRPAGPRLPAARAAPAACCAATGQTEAAVDLARLAGLNPAGVVCEVMNDDGTMARVPDLIPYCERHGLKMITVADLIEYRRRHGEARRAHDLGAAADRLRRVHRGRVPRDADRQAPPRARQGRGRRAPRTCSCASTPSA